MIHEASARSRAQNGNFELWSWLFMRVSGIILLVMVLVHFAIMHVTTPIEDVNYAWVAGRYSTSGWRVYDIVVLFLGLIHGLNGVRVVSDDLIHSRGWRVVVVALLYVVAFLFLVIGAQVILSFQPVAGS